MLSKSLLEISITPTSYKTLPSMLLLLLLSHFSHVRLCVTPVDSSPPGSPVPGILQARTLEWVPSPMHASEKWKGSRSVVSDSSRPHGLQPTMLLCPWDFPLEWGAIAFSNYPLWGHLIYVAKHPLFKIYIFLGVFLLLLKTTIVLTSAAHILKLERCRED